MLPMPFEANGHGEREPARAIECAVRGFMFTGRFIGRFNCAEVERE
jgi:hypothetical protein